MTLTISNIISILFGCLTGFSIFITILFKKKYSKILTPTKELVNTFENENTPLVQEIIKKHYISYIKSNKKEKKNILDITKNMAEDISKLFNPNSEKPLLELSIKELLTFFDHYVNKIESIIYSLGIDGIEDLKINTIINVVILGKKVYNVSSAKIVKVLIKCFNFIFMIKNIIYIPYWIKKGTSKTINKSFTNLLIYSYFEFLGIELTYIYHK